MKAEIGVAVSMEPITAAVIGRVAQQILGARLCPARPATVKIIGICAPRIACAATRTRTLRLARLSVGAAWYVMRRRVKLWHGRGKGQMRAGECVSRRGGGEVVLPRPLFALMMEGGLWGWRTQGYLGQGERAVSRGAGMRAGRIIRTEACVAEGAAWLAAREARFAEALALTGPLPLRRSEAGFRALLSAIVSQQVSVASANAIWARMEAAGLCDAGAMAVASADALRAVGLSRQKARYGQALAAAGIDFDALGDAPDDEVVAVLTAVPGIGRWTAEIYAMFALGRADVFAPGDLALQEAAKVLFGMEARPSERALRAMAEDWSPWRAVAARLLWAYYRVAKEREGIR